MNQLQKWITFEPKLLFSEFMSIYEHFLSYLSKKSEFGPKVRFSELVGGLMRFCPKNEGINFEKLICMTGHIFTGLIGVNKKNIFHKNNKNKDIFFKSG